eukprot:TRINITY_DN64847_c0_g1_i1.p1 TRINITY_DN64847_c0_g1~~TRINITY_DN64847_c0_g1_i1.p1  ORF type:complete len:739 (-),score=113.86 TRINITY_DN64847_c0_g1_i1:121-2337(-)
MAWRWEPLAALLGVAASLEARVAPAASAASQTKQPQESGCWGGDLTAELCCGREFDASGRPVCFDAVFTAELCCGGPEERARRDEELAAWRRGIARAETLARARVPLSAAGDARASSSTRSEKTQPRTTRARREVFDYVVVGGGSGGSTAAATLAAHPSRPSVLLLEAGEWDQYEEYYGSTVVNKAMTHWKRPVWWLVRSVAPFRWWTGGTGEDITYALKVGRALGGGSAVNRGLYSRGGTGELAAGLRWREEEIETAFERVKGRLRASAKAKGRVAPVLKGWRRDELPIFLQVMVKAFADAGVPFRELPHDGSVRTLHGVHSGTWLSIACSRKTVGEIGRDASHVDHVGSCSRQTSYSGLVAPWNRSLSNLVVRPYSMATRLRFGGATAADAQRVTGVEVSELRSHTDAEKLIVASTSPSSPGSSATAASPPPGPSSRRSSSLGYALHFGQLAENWESMLRRSYDVAARHGYVLAAGAIGSPALLLRSGAGPSGTADHLHTAPKLNISSIGEGLRDRIAIPLGVITTEPCKLGYRSDDIPMLFAFFNFSETNDSPTDDGSVEAELNIAEDCSEEGYQAFSLRFILQRTEGVGRLHVPSPHPFVSPQAELHATHADLRRVQAMIRWFYIQVLRHVAVWPYVAYTAPSEQAVGDDRSMDAFVVGSAQWYLHPSGSLSRGAADRHLRLHSLPNVHVADASVLPGGLPSGHQEASIRMLGEVVAQRLLLELEQARLRRTHA